MLQVDLVRHSVGTRLVWGEDFTRVFTILYFKDFVNSWINLVWFCYLFAFMNCELRQLLL